MQVPAAPSFICGTFKTNCITEAISKDSNFFVIYAFPIGSKSKLDVQRTGGKQRRKNLRLVGRARFSEQLIDIRNQAFFDDIASARISGSNSVDVIRVELR